MGVSVWKYCFVPSILQTVSRYDRWKICKLVHRRSSFHKITDRFGEHFYKAWHHNNSSRRVIQYQLLWRGSIMYSVPTFSIIYVRGERKIQFCSNDNSSAVASSSISRIQKPISIDAFVTPAPLFARICRICYTYTHQTIHVHTKYLHDNWSSTSRLHNLHVYLGKQTDVSE